MEHAHPVGPAPSSRTTSTQQPPKNHTATCSSTPPTPSSLSKHKPAPLPSPVPPQDRNQLPPHLMPDPKSLRSRPTPLDRKTSSGCVSAGERSTPLRDGSRADGLEFERRCLGKAMLVWCTPGAALDLEAGLVFVSGLREWVRCGGGTSGSGRGLLRLLWSRLLQLLLRWR